MLVLAALWWDGSFDLRYWAPLTILCLALLAALLLAGALELPRSLPLRVAVAAIWGLAALTYLSAAWSESPAAAWDGGARTALFAAAFTLALAVGPGSGRRRLGDLLVVGVALAAAIVLLRLLVEGNDLFVAGRLNPPVGYRNGTAALFAFAAWPLLGLAARHGVRSGLRAAALGLAVLVLGLAFMTQSRGVLLGLAAGGLVSLSIGPDRVRRSWLALAALVAVAAVATPLLAPFDAFDAGVAVSDDDAREAALALLAAGAGAFLLGLLLFVLDNGLRVDLQARARLRQLATIGLAVLAVFAAAIALGRVGDPVSYADAKLDEFTGLEADTTVGAGTRLGTVGGQRYDLYRIAFDQFLERPLAGAGEGSYPFAYYRERHTDRNLDNPHSLPLRVLAATGLAGLGLLAAWLVGIGVAVARRARAAAAGERAWLAGLAAAGATVVVQSFVDWLWLLPALFGLAVLALGLAAGEGERDAPAREGGKPAGRWGAGRVGALLGLVLALASLTALFLADVYVRKAREEAPRSPQAALDAARTAERLNPVAIVPLYLQAGALESQGRGSAARAALQEAREQEPRNFVTLALLGDLEVRAGRDRRARSYYRAALALNPKDVGLEQLSARR